MKLVREHFDTFIRSADSVEHFALAFEKVDVGDSTTSDSSGHAPRTIPSSSSPAAAVETPSIVHASALGLSSSSARSRRGSFLGSGAQNAVLEASVASLARVDLMGLQDLVTIAQKDARDAFGLLLSRGARLRAHKLARQKLAGWGAGVVDAPQRMAECLEASPSLKLAEAVGHWRRVRRALAAAATAAAAAPAASSGADGPSSKPVGEPTRQSAAASTSSSGRRGLTNSNDSSNSTSGSAGSANASASMLLRRVSGAAESVGLRVRVALQAELAAFPGEGTPGASPVSNTPLGSATNTTTTAGSGQARDSFLKSSGGVDAQLNGANSGSNAGGQGAAAASGAVRTSRLLRAAALLVEIGPGLDAAHSSSSGSRRRRGSSNSSSCGTGLPPVAAPLPQSLLPRRIKKAKDRPPTSPVQGTASAAANGGAAATAESPPSPSPPLSPVSPLSPPASPLARTGIFGNAAAEAARAREVNRARRSAVARSPHLGGLLFQASHLKVAAQFAARRAEKDRVRDLKSSSSSTGRSGHQATTSGVDKETSRRSTSAPSSSSFMATVGAGTRRPPRRGSLALMERASRAGAAFGSDDESDDDSDSSAVDDDDDDGEVKDDQGKRKFAAAGDDDVDKQEDESLAQVSPWLRELLLAKAQRAVATVASAKLEFDAARDEERRNAKIQAKLKVGRPSISFVIL